MKKLILLLLFLPVFCYSQQILTGGGKTVQLGGKQGVTGFLPSDHDSLKLWLYGEKISTSGGFVTSWLDQSGNGHNATQSTGSYQPSYIASGIAGHPIVHFDSINDFLTCGTALGKPANYTIFIVFRMVNINITQTACGSLDAPGTLTKSWGAVKNNSTTPGKLFYTFSDGSNVSQGNTSAAVFTNNTFGIYTEMYTTGQNACEVWSNGISKAITIGTPSATTNSGTAYDFCLGRFGAYNGVYLHGDIAELIVYSTSFTTTQRAMVEIYLSNKYAIPLVFMTPSYYENLWQHAINPLNYAA